ncbi:hypothetical protein OYT1_ch0878 [Ferriphaselus amnicola]|uniref:Uncharacterized protein n=1 Tax=Ferriphaselus amnicola TaxID=1188319 RepID=A0A2Z6GA74_9PROT|nr:hypothetical protein [Ferriphaselus amnicola]BBE50441.1 hypothetical protein OYT1_ch0878 [Ferriphaselus amnicola]
MKEGVKYVLVEIPESEDIAQRLTQVGLKGTMLGYASQEVSAELFMAAPDLRDALAVLNSFCNSTSVYMSVPPIFMERADSALNKARRK